MGFLEGVTAQLPTLVSGLAMGCLLYTLALGLSLIFGMMDVLNLAHGTLYLAGAYVGVLVIGDSPSWSTYLVALLLAALLGIALGGLLAGMVMPLAGRGHMDQALLTLGLALIGASLMEAWFGGDIHNVSAPPALSGNVEILGQFYPVYRLALIALGAVAAVLVTLLLRRTAVGALVRATVSDRDMVRAIGIDTRLILFGVFGFGGLLAVCAGILGGPLLGAAPGLDHYVLLIALIVVVVGGLGSPAGALLGALLIGVVQSLGTALVPSVAPFLLFGAMALVLILRPGGLLGRVSDGEPA